MKNIVKDYPWLAVAIAVVAGAMIMFALSWGWLRGDRDQEDVAAPEAEQPAEMRYCLGLAQVTDGAARARSALAAGDSPGLRVAARSIRQGYNDAQAAAQELPDTADLGNLTQPVQQVRDLAGSNTALRQATTFTPLLDTITTGAGEAASDQQCASRLAGENPAPTTSPSPSPSAAAPSDGAACSWNVVTSVGAGKDISLDPAENPATCEPDPLVRTARRILAFKTAEGTGCDPGDRVIVTYATGSKGVSVLSGYCLDPDGTPRFDLRFE